MTKTQDRLRPNGSDVFTPPLLLLGGDGADDTGDPGNDDSALLAPLLDRNSALLALLPLLLDGDGADDTGDPGDGDAAPASLLDRDAALLAALPILIIDGDAGDTDSGDSGDTDADAAAPLKRFSI